MTPRWLPLGLATALLLACGGTTTGEMADTAVPGGGADVDPDEEGAAAEEAWSRGDLAGAEHHASRALAVRTDQGQALRVAARLALARGEHDRVVELLGEAHSVDLVRLRARARAAAGDLPGAAQDLVAVDGRPPEDGWAASFLPVARAAAGRAAYDVSGPDRATLPFVGRAPVPIVEIAVDGRVVNALVASSADLTVVDETIRANPGVAGTLELGPIRVDNVPVLTRDLAPIGEQLGVSLGAVVGTDLLLRLAFTFDFRERWVAVRTAGRETAEGAPEVPFLTFESTFLTVEAELEGEAEGFLTFDTAGVFPIALEPAAAEALGRELDALPPAPGAPDERIRMLTLSRLRMGGVAIDGVPAAVGLVPDGLSALAGAPIAGIVGAGALQQMKVTIDPTRRVIVFE